MGDRTPDADSGRGRPTGLVVGGALSVLLLVGSLVWVGPTAVLEALADARPEPLLLAVLASAVSVGCRHLAYLVLYRAADAGPDGIRFHLLVLFAGIPRWLLPVGYVAGPAINGLYLSRGIGSRYVPTVAALAVAEFLASVGSLVVVLTGLGLLVVTGTPVPGGMLVTASGITLIGLVVLGFAVFGVRPKWVARVVARLQLWLEALVERFGPTRSLQRVVGGRIQGFLGSLQAVTADRRQVYMAFVLSGLGWFVGTVTLYFCLSAVGAPVPIGVAMVAVPLSTLAGVVPVPAGIGSTELTLATVVVAVGGVSAPVAAAGVVLFRVSTVGLELGAGGVSGALLATTGRRPDPV